MKTQSNAKSESGFQPYTIQMSENYGPLRAGRTYKVIEEGRDYVVVRANHKRYCVAPELVKLTQDKESDDDDELDEDFLAAAYKNFTKYREVMKRLAD